MSTTAFSKPAPQRSGQPLFAYWSPERAVLTHLLDQHPRRLTLQELAHEVGHGFEETAVKRAVDNLAAAREGAALIPAPAVVSFDQGPATTNF